MSYRRVGLVLLLCLAAFTVGHFTKRAAGIRHGHPTEFTVTYPLPAGSIKHRERVTLQVWQIWENGEPYDVGESSTHPQQWAVTVNNVTYFASPVVTE